MTQRLIFSILALSSISFAFATTEPNRPADTTEDLRSQFEFDRKLDEEYAGQSYPKRGDVAVAPDLYELGPQKYDFKTTSEPNRPADTTEDLLSQFEFDRRRDEEYAGQSYPLRGDVVVTPDLYELGPKKSDFETTISELEKSISEQETFSARVPLDTEPAGVPTSPKRILIGTEPITEPIKVSRSTVEPKVKASDSLPKNHERDPKPAEPTTAVPTESKQKGKTSQDTYHLYKKIKTVLRQHDIDSRLNGDSSTSGDGFVPTLASFPGRKPSEDDAGNDIIMAAVLPAVIVLVACLVITSLGILLYCIFRKPAKTIDGERSGSGSVHLTGAHNRLEAYEIARSNGLSPNQRFCTKGNYYVPNIVDQMPEDLLYDKTVYVDPKSDKLVRSDARCRSLSPLVGMEHDEFYSKLLDNQALKTPAGLGEDADSQSLSSDSRLRFVTVPLDDDDTAPTPTGGKSVGHVTHVCHI